MASVRSVVRGLLLARYQVLAGLFLPGIVPLALYANPDLFRNVLVLETPWQLFNVTWLALLAAALVLIASRVTLLNARDRFADYRASAPPPATPQPGWTRAGWVLFLVMGLPVPVACVALIARDPSPFWAGWFGGGPAVALAGASVVLLGLASALSALALFTALQLLLLDPGVTAPGLLPFESWGRLRALHAVRIGWLDGAGNGLARVLSRLGPGYTRTLNGPQGGPSHAVLSPGHAQVALWLGLSVLAYLLSYLLVLRGGQVPGEASPYPALFFLLLVVTVMTALLSGLAFFLDYYRVPVLLALIAASVAFNALSRADHYYELKPPREGDRPAADLALTDAFAQKTFPKVGVGGRAGRRTLVVVTAAGGGIQAAAWTARVLTGLDELYGPDFTRSVGLISAVSGGSVGAMYFLANGDWDSQEAPFDAAARGRTLTMSRASGLEATAWGMAFPDLMRALAPYAVGGEVDRGWAIEKAWQAQLGAAPAAAGGDLRLRDWVEPVRLGRMPVPAFNCTLVETGQRLVISPVRGEHPDSAINARDFFQLYPGDQADLRVTTAVRLSATFPYVSPVSRPGRPGGAVDPQNDYHVADGGYVDNEGVFTVVDWLGQLLHYYEQPENRGRRPFDRILVIRVQPFPYAAAGPPGTNEGWLYAALGPVLTIQNVRVASQAERNGVALKLLSDSASAGRAGGALAAARTQTLRAERDLSRAKGRDQLLRADITAEQADRAGTYKQGGSAAALRREAAALQESGRESVRKAAQTGKALVPDETITWTAFVFHTETGRNPPLSWKLTQNQKNAIDDAWDRLVRGESPEIPNGLQEHPLATLDRFFPRSAAK
jgi:hypothetical protein